MAGSGDAPDLSGLPLWVQAAFTFGGLVAGAILVRLGYRRPAEAAEHGRPDTGLAGIGAVLADGGAILQLAASIDRAADAVTAHTAFLEARDLKARAADDREELRQDLLETVRQEMAKRRGEEQ